MPDVIAQAETKDKRPKKTTILKVGLPLDPKGKGKAKEVTPPIDVSDGEERLDWGSNDDDYDVDMALAESAGIHQHNNSWYQDTSNGDPMDSVAYNGIAPQVPFLSIGLIGSLIIESSQGQLYSGLGRVDTPACTCNIENTRLSASSCTECEKCKNSAMEKTRTLVRDYLDENSNEVEFIGDSGASATFTYNLSDFTEYNELDNSLEARTANKGVPLKIKGSRTVFLKHKVSKGHTVTIWLNPVYYIPGLSVRLLSIGEWLQQVCKLVGTKLSMAIQQGSSIALTLYPKGPGETIY